MPRENMGFVRCRTMEGLLVGGRPSTDSTLDTVDPSRDRIACSVSWP
jgi:hypothetical protein